MDSLTEFWERRARSAESLKSSAVFGAFVLTGLAVVAYQRNGALALLLGVFAAWCLGIRLVYELWGIDEKGDSRARRASAPARVLTGMFYCVWFVALAAVTCFALVKLVGT